MSTILRTTPFVLELPPATIDDLVCRLRNAKWPNVIDENADEKGVSMAWLRDVATYWADGYDWAKSEAEVNRLRQFTATVGTERMHFVHEHGRGEPRLPILLIHGWPDCFLLPGFGFSEQPSGALSLDTPPTSCMRC